MGKVYTATAPQYSAGDTQPDRLNIRGEKAVIGPAQQAIFEGRAWQVTVGTFSTPIQGGGAGTIVDADQPEFVLNVPAGTVASLLRVRADVQVALLAADSEEAEIILAVDRAAEVAAGTYTSETPINLRTDIVSGARCTARSAYTGNTTAAPTLSMELAHPVALGDVQGTAANAMWTQLALEYDPRQKIYIVGPGAVVLYWGGTVAANGFAGVEWAEYTTAELGL